MTDDDFLPPSATQIALSPSAGAGIAGLLIGCTLLVSACMLMVFNVILHTRGLLGVPRDLAQVGGFIGTGVVALLGVFAVVLGIRSWGAARKGESRALGIGATAASAVGLIAWLVAGIDLMMILLD
jgi:hypothetical protein